MLPTLDEAIAAIKAGDKAGGRAMLANIIQADLENELAWLWLSSVATSDEERRKCMQQVLEINPDNVAAKRGLAKLEAKQTAQSPGAVTETSSESTGSLQSRLTNPPKAEEPVSEAADLPASQRYGRPSPPPPETIDTSLLDRPASSEPELGPESAITATAAATAVAGQSDPAQDEVRHEKTDSAEPADAEQTEIEPDADSVPEPAAEAEVTEPDPEAGEAEDIPPDAPIPLALYRLRRYGQTEQGMVVIGSIVAITALICVACVVFGAVFQPVLVQLPPTLAAAVGTDTPTPTLTPIPPDTPTATLTPSMTPTPSPTLTPTPTATNTPVVADTATVTLTPTRTPTPDPSLQQARVIRVLEGDLIEVLIDDMLYQVRYILIDAPGVDPEVGVEPFGPEALALNRRLVEDKEVTLEIDQEESDEFDRLLRYVYVDNIMVNEELLRQGLAQVELIPPNLKHGARLQAVEQSAKAANIGIWSQEP